MPVSKRQDISRKAYLWLGGGMLLLAAFFRLAGLEQAYVGGDQASILGPAADIVALRSFPLTGIKSSMGVMQSPVALYLAAIPLLLARSVLAVKWFISVLDLLALALLYRSMRQAFGMLAALITGLIYATHPWVIEFVRYIWYQSFLPIFSTMTFAGLLWSLTTPYRKQAQIGLAFALVSATLMGFVHLVALPWMAVLIVLGALWAWRKRLWRGFLVGGALSGLIAAPYFGYLLRTDFADVLALLNSGTGRGWSFGNLRMVGELISSRYILRMAHSPIWQEAVWEPAGVYLIYPILLGVAGLGTLGALLTKTQGAWVRGMLLAAGWILLPPLLFVRPSVHMQHFYALFMYPAPFVFVGGWIGRSFFGVASSWWSRVERVGAHAMTVLVILLTAWWGYIWVVRIPLEQEGKIHQDRVWLMDRVLQEISSYLREDPTHAVIILNNESGDISGFDWIRSFVGDDQVRTTFAQSGLIIPPTETCYLLGPGVSVEYLEPVMSQLVQRDDMTIKVEPPWQFYCGKMLPDTRTPLAVWENGLSLLGVEVSGTFAPGGTLALRYTWRYSGAVPQTLFSFYNHLMFGDTLLAQVDGPGVLSDRWREGDILKTYYALPVPDSLPSGTIQLRTGCYGLHDLQRVALEDGGDGVEVAAWTMMPEP
ncbi:MAG: hypothetical protein JXB35_12400 [Anaerolineae bacterium]|nr:hypothetical protein [Anaerolineae bacterium]